MKRVLFSLLIVAMLTTVSALAALAADEWNPQTQDLLAGQDMRVGEVSVWDDGSTLYVKYEISAPDWQIRETHVAVAEDPANFPQTKKGNPKVGHFAWSMEHDPWVAEFTQEIPITELGTGASPYIAAHAEVVTMVDDEIVEESAWAAGSRFVERGSWATYFVYNVEETVTLSIRGNATAEWSTDQAYTGDDSAHLETLGDPGSGDEARIVMPAPEGTTLADIAAVSWWEYLVAGYPPHLDIMLDIDGDGTIDDSLVFEYAYNDVALHYLEGPMPYGALTSDWYQTFSDDGNGPAQVDDAAYGWLSSGPPGPPGAPTFISGTLADWKSGLVDPAIKGTTSVVSLEIEVDNWIAQTEAYVDDIEIVIDGVTYTIDI